MTLFVEAVVPPAERGQQKAPTEQQSVVEPMLAARSDRANVGRLKNRWNVRTADGAATVVSIKDDSLEGPLAEPVGRQPRIAEHGSWPVPWLAEVEFHLNAEGQLQKPGEVWLHRWLGKVVALAPHDVGGEWGGGAAMRSGGKKQTSRTNRQPITGSSVGPIGARR